MKTISRGRRPQNIKGGIYYQQLIWSSSNFKIKLRGTNQNWKLPAIKTTSNGRQPQILKVEYLSIQWSDLPQTFLLEMKTQQFIGLSSTFKLKFRGQPKLKIALYEDDL